MLDEPRAFKYWLSPDKQYLLMAIRPQKLFRHRQHHHHEIIGFVYILEVLEFPKIVIRNHDSQFWESDTFYRSTYGSIPPKTEIVKRNLLTSNLFTQQSKSLSERLSESGLLAPSGTRSKQPLRDKICNAEYHFATLEIQL